MSHQIIRRGERSRALPKLKCGVRLRGTLPPRDNKGILLAALIVWELKNGYQQTVSMRQQIASDAKEAMS